MNLETLKNVFFIGTSEKVDELCASLKPRCIQPTDKLATIGGTTERLLYNSENDTYISQHMDVYKECPYCHELEKIDDFVTVNLPQQQWFRDEGKRNFTKTITLCRRCLESETVVVPEIAGNRYLLLNNPDTVPLVYPADSDHPDDLRIGFCSNHTRVRLRNNYFSNQSDFVDLASYDYENDRVVTYQHDVASAVLWHKSLTTTVYVPFSSATLLKSEVESHPETWVQCSECHRYYHHSLIENGKCPGCREVKIYNYHHWDGQLEFLKSDTDNPDEKTFFGTEVETCGHTENKQYVSPYQHIWHLEYDGSLGYGGFEMISQPMTLAYAKEHASEFETMFQELRDHDQKSHDTSCCGYHVHVSRSAFVDDDAVYRAVALVNKFQNQMQKFARRGSQHYCRYSRIADTFTRDDIVRIVRDGDRYDAVNLTNHGSKKNTIEFRIFRGTLNHVTYLATLEFVANIVKAANEGKSFVKFGELLEGEYIEQYISDRAKYDVTFDREETISFIGFNLGRKFNELCNGTLPVNDFIAAVNSAFAMEGGAA